jgi:hypothetical protein
MLQNSEHRAEALRRTSAKSLMNLHANFDSPDGKVKTWRSTEGPIVLARVSPFSFPWLLPTDNDSRNQFSDLTQSVLAGSHRALRSWMLCCFLLVIVFFSNEQTAFLLDPNFDKAQENMPLL